jgi:hypothetical protein
MKPEDWPPEAVEALRAALLDGLRSKRPGHVITLVRHEGEPVGNAAAPGRDDEPAHPTQGT